MIRCTPFDTPQQQIIKATTTIIPHCTVAKSFDTFGNLLQSGYIPEMHDALMFESKGVVNVTEHIYQESLNRLFLYPTPLTQPTAEIVSLADKLKADKTHNFIVNISNYLAENFRYQQGTTTVNTTAGEALSQGSGVCQDYSHIMISLCRQNNIAARYIAGFMIGEGATHAWIEYYDGGLWFAYDPTNNRVVDDSYIKIAQGRDFNDCSINRGRFTGSVQQTIRVTLKVEQQKHYSKV